MVDFRPLLFANALALMLLVTAGFATIQRAPDLVGSSLSGPGAVTTSVDRSAPATSPDTSTSARPTVTPPPPTTEADTPAAVVGQTQPNPEPVTPAAPASAAQASAGQNEEAITQTTSMPSSEAISPSVTDKAAVDATEKPMPTQGLAAPDASGTTPAIGAAGASIEAAAQPAQKPEPAPTTGQLVVRSNVVGDSVSINGKDYGSTRLDLKLKPGNYDVTVAKQGFQPWHKEVSLDAGDELTLHALLDAYTTVDYQHGTWRGGVVTGEGTYVDDNGLHYKGEFRNGEFDGHGIAHFANGAVYEGQWEGGKMNGQGTLTQADGDTYTGQFKDGQFNGEGTLTKANGDIYSGHWVDGKLNGQGTLTTKAGLMYVGGFLDGQFQGQGKLTYPDGRHYEGGFTKGQFQGKGVEIYASGKKYEGQFMDGQYHGEGVLYNPNGSKIQATFRYGKPYGQVKLTTPEGEVFTARTSEPGVCYRESSYRATQCPPLEGW